MVYFKTRTAYGSI